ncbi:hypothetical protein H310_07139 [Aphanomyces invadans]|uniref:Uncharacterized protein n=1 Tax=Aphanomyces invadans TaxID=157072 RepID=A0A024U2T0_9STRA|nr:hypothetical protein H310_07139 [Aphanomyces invadans]ETW00554.1 hypothetical protein H310_07139 [Aphanomyces invadans]|eukprot:XP_008870689.1 hypothetical protein H310_07139 [Aphanomyces invadans]
MTATIENVPAEIQVNLDEGLEQADRKLPVDEDDDAVVDEKLKHIEDELKLEREHDDPVDDDAFKSISYAKRVEKLDSLLEKAGAYSKFLLSNMEPIQVEANVVDNAATPLSSKKRKGRQPKIKDGASKLQKINENQSGAHTVSEMKFKQPSLFTGGTLRAYQLEGIQWMCNLFENGLNGILADEMGLGKTVQVIGMLAQLKAKGVRGPYLVVAPLSTLSNWYNEFEKFTPTIPAMIYHGTTPERKLMRSKQLKRGTQTNPDFPIIITSYEVIIRDASSFNSMGFVWKFMIIDEGHRLKNMDCLLMRELKKCRSENRLLLSGTPLQNNLSELWSLLNFLLPDVFDDLALFQSWFNSSSANASATTDDIISKHDVLTNQKQGQVVSKLHEILRPFVLRRLKTDVVLDVPSKTEIVVYCPMTDLQASYYKLIADKELAKALQEKHGKSANAAMTLRNMAVQLRKCCNHPYLFDEDTDASGNVVTGDHLIEAAGKLVIMDSMLKQLLQNGHKVLIFSQMTRVLDILEDYLHHRNYKYCRLDGRTNFSERQQSMDAFNKPESDLQVFLLSTRAGGLGINLTGGDTVILYDSDWNPHQDNQAQDRVHRIGQTKDVVVYRLITENSFENRMLQRANAKRTLERVVLSRGEFSSVSGEKANPSSLTMEELENLLKDDIQIRQEATGGISESELAMLCDRKQVVDAFVKKTTDVPRETKGYYVVDSASSRMESYT